MGITAANVLVVDDSSTARKMLIRVLPKTMEATISQASNGSEAVGAFKSARPDLIFLDLNMPVMDGYEVLEALQHEPSLPPVIVLTGDIQPGAQERVMALGARAFVKKPVSEAQLAALLRDCGFC